MRRDDPGDAGFQVEDAAGSNVVTHWVMFVLLSGMAGGVLWLLRGRLVFDIDSPDFNPLVLAVAFFGLFALVSLAKALRWTWQKRRFGAASLSLSGDGLGRLGRPLEGVVRTATTLQPEGDFRFHLRCVESHDFGEPGSAGTRRPKSFVVWEKTLDVPSEGIDSARGIPFAFELPPAVAAPTPHPPRDPNGVHFRFRMALTIPFTKHRVISRGVAPLARTWELEVVASLPGRDFRTAFVIPMDPAQR